MTSAIDRLLAIMARLRRPGDGCPWDLEQTFATIAPHTIEEAYEVAEAIDSGDREALKDELGDLLFQVVFHARLAEEEGIFSFVDVAEAISDKMERRHPHVFAAERVADTAEQMRAWESLKAQERAAKTDQNGGSATLAGVSVALPALTRAQKLQARAARVGFDWAEAAPVLDKIDEELDELRDALAEGAAPNRLKDEMGDLLFACVNLARKLGIDPEGALRHGNRKFERRFGSVERALAEKGKHPADSTLDEMESLWREAKAQE